MAALPAAAEQTGSGCGLTPRPHGVTKPSARVGDVRTADVLVYGDSLTYQTQDLLRGLASSVAVDAAWGRGTQAAVARMAADVKARGADLPAVVVMATGTNDTQVVPSEVAAQVRAARAVLPTRVRLLWVDVYVESGANYLPVDLAIRGVPGVEVVEWGLANVRRLHLDGSSHLLVDGIHVNCVGGRVRTDLLHRALVERPDARVTPRQRPARS